MHKGYYFQDRFERIRRIPFRLPLSPSLRRVTDLSFAVFLRSLPASSHIYYSLFVYVSIYLLTYLSCLLTEFDVSSLASFVSLVFFPLALSWLFDLFANRSYSRGESVDLQRSFRREKELRLKMMDR